MAPSAVAEKEFSTNIPNLSNVSFAEMDIFAGREMASIETLVNPEGIPAAKFQSAF
ncbi:hypothetical protein [Herbidospora galbida]|uniref:hypothetical protein n=1 Tax=Herbidospora galbida TaxID=2575442 RepID=UPI0014859354|nr:hypothetical protein [Herbidospora galbida]